eukprot:6186173-Pleurochrysis_carterae.AAC.9
MRRLLGVVQRRLFPSINRVMLCARSEEQLAHGLVALHRRQVQRRAPVGIADAWVGAARNVESQACRLALPRQLAHRVRNVGRVGAERAARVNNQLRHARVPAARSIEQRRAAPPIGGVHVCTV